MLAGRVKKLHWKGWLAVLVAVATATLPAMAQSAASGPSGALGADSAALVPGHFVDITEKSGIKFLHQAPHTSRKYLIETMGSGVALFDCDNDGRLDIFLVNGAPFYRPHAQRIHPTEDRPRILESPVPPEAGWNL